MEIEWAVLLPHTSWVEDLIAVSTVRTCWQPRWQFCQENTASMLIHLAKLISCEAVQLSKSLTIQLNKFQPLNYLNISRSPSSTSVRFIHGSIMSDFINTAHCFTQWEYGSRQQYTFSSITYCIYGGTMGITIASQLNRFGIESCINYVSVGGFHLQSKKRSHTKWHF